MTVTCLALGEPLGDASAAGATGRRAAVGGESFGFTWTRNRALLPLSPGKEVWEDLVPAGSLLRLYNVRRTATYCCQVRGRTLSRTACSDVHVVGEAPGASEAVDAAAAGAVPVCAGGAAELEWPDTAAGAEARLPCPPQYTGRAAVRACGLVDTGHPRWGQPDFSQCESRQLAAVRERLEAVTLGLSNASAAGVLSSALSLASAALRLPGEGGALLGLLRGAAQHLADLPRPPPTASTAPVLDAASAATQDTPPSPKASTAATSEADQIRKLSLEGLDLLLRRPRALNSEQHVVEMQRLARSVSLLWAASPQVAAGAAERLSLPAMAVSVASVAPDPHDQSIKVHFPAPASRWADWTEGFVDVVLRLGAAPAGAAADLEQATQAPKDNATLAAPGAVGLAVVAYRNLSKLLPERLVMKQE
ncbi:hypothetical protein FOCC_FOCC008105 [Frankliniella occidentalis]|nr:hypothetical protein FOCC_FOCC008105 [Frankliniella occidentalis]